MTPEELWTWLDAINSIRIDDEREDFFRDWSNRLMDEITQGRGIIANVTFDGGILVSAENDLVHIYGCTFKDLTSAYPLNLNAPAKGQP